MLEKRVTQEEILAAARSSGRANVVIETWRQHYNDVRPHSSLGYQTPAEFSAKMKEQDARPEPATGRTAAICGACWRQLFVQPGRFRNT